MKHPALWFCDYDKEYEGKEPSFYSVQEINVAMALEASYPVLREELKILWEKGEKESTFQGFGDYDSFDNKQFPPRSWQKMVFKVWGLRNNRICSKFPVTASLLEKHPNITSCFVTKTSPRSIIKPHCGETNAHIRIHLGLHLPEADATICGMEVLSKRIGWQNGKTFAFLDAHHHHVWNNSDSDRYVLIVDVIRPEFAHRKHFVFARVIVSQLFFYFVHRFKMKFLYNISTAVLDVATWLVYAPIRIAMAFNNKFNIVKL